MRKSPLLLVLALAGALPGLAGETVTYSTRWIQGTKLKLGSSPSAQVWASLHWEGKDPAPYLFIYVANAGKEPVTLYPSAMAFSGTNKGKEKQVIGYSAAEWREKVARQNRWDGVARGMFGDSGGSHVSAVYTDENGEPVGYMYGEVEASPEERARQTERFEAGLRERYAELTANLLENQTLDPGEAYGGRVYLKSKTLDVLRVTVNFAGSKFSFEF